MKLSTKKMVACALMAALTAICSQIAFPIGLVPINLAMLAVFIAGGFLGPISGMVSQIVYIMLGAIGIPVFASFTGGVGILVGPTGGYIVGYAVAALLTGMIIKYSNKSFIMYIIAMLIGLLACYILGTAWFMFVMKKSMIYSLSVCVAPFVVFDILKILLATVVVRKLNKLIKL